MIASAPLSLLALLLACPAPKPVRTSSLDRSSLLVQQTQVTQEAQKTQKDGSQTARLVPAVGHAPGPVRVAASLDGRLLATGGVDGVVLVRDSQDGHLVQVLGGSGRSIDQLLWSTDPAHPEELYVLDSGGQTTAWQAWTGRRLREHQRWDRAVDMALSPSGGRMLLANGRGASELDPFLGKRLDKRNLSRFTRRPKVAFTASGDPVIGGSTGLVGWYPTKGRAKRWRPHEGAVLDLVTAGDRLVSVGEDRVLSVWDRLVEQHIQLDEAPLELVTLDNFRVALRYSWGVELLALDTLERRGLQLSPDRTVSALAPAHGGQLLVGYQDGSAELLGQGWELEQPATRLALSGLGRSVMQVEAGGGLALIGAPGGPYHLWDLNTGAPPREMAMARGAEAVAMSSDGAELLVAGQGRLSLRSTAPCATSREVQGLRYAGRAASIDLHDGVPVVGTEQGMVLWPSRLLELGAPVRAVSTRGGRVMAVSRSGALAVWTLDGEPLLRRGLRELLGQPLATLQITDATLSHDGQRVHISGERADIRGRHGLSWTLNAATGALLPKTAPEQPAPQLAQTETETEPGAEDQPDVEQSAWQRPLLAVTTLPDGRSLTAGQGGAICTPEGDWCLGEPGTLHTSLAATGDWVLAGGVSGFTQVYSVQEQALVASLLAWDAGGQAEERCAADGPAPGWAALDPEHRYDLSSPDSAIPLAWVLAGASDTPPVAVGFGQLKHSLYYPGLLPVLLGAADRPRLCPVGPLLLAPPPALTLHAGPWNPSRPTLQLCAQDRGSGLGPLRVQLNHRTLTPGTFTLQTSTSDYSDAPEVACPADSVGLTLTLNSPPTLKPYATNTLVVQQLGLPLMADQISDQTTTCRAGASAGAPQAEGLLEGVASRPVTVQFGGPSPRRYAIQDALPRDLLLLLVGVHDYQIDGLDLQFPHRDAQDIARTLARGGTKLYDRVVAVELTTDSQPARVYVGNQGRVDTYSLTDPQDREALPDDLTTLSALKGPSKDGVLLAMDWLAGHANPNSTVAVFLAGHGQIQDDDAGREQWYFLPREGDPNDLSHTAVSMTTLSSILADSAASNQAVILDTCASGAAAEQLREGVPAETRRELDRAKDEQGLFILAGSTGSAAAFEHPDLRHGVLTWSLMRSMFDLEEQLREGDSNWNIGMLFEATASKVPHTAQMVGQRVQQPVYLRPSGAAFGLGRQFTAALGEVDLPDPNDKRPRVAPPVLMDKEQLGDPRRLSRDVEDLLRTAEASGAPLTVRRAGTYQLRGLYSSRGGAPRLALFKGSEDQGCSVPSPRVAPELQAKALSEWTQACVAEAEAHHGR